eukprot:gene1161-4055_t
MADSSYAEGGEAIIGSESVADNYLLPPVIFYAALGVEKKLFFSNLGPIWLLRRGLGTFICITFIAT